MTEKITMPLVPLRGLTVFPRTILHFDIGREKSIKALDEAMKGDKLLFLAPQKDDAVLIPTKDDYYHIGTVVKVKQMLKIQGDAIRVLVDGQYRAKIDEIVQEDPFILAEIEEAEITKYDKDDVEIKALIRACLNSFGYYTELNPDMKPEAKEVLNQIDDPDILSDTICMQLDVSIADKQKIGSS